MGKLTDKQKIDIVKEYSDNINSTCRGLAKKYKVSPQSITSIIVNRGIKIRNDMSRIKTKYDVSSDYFEKIDTEDKAYFLGLLYADGYIRENGVGISLQERDKDILEKLIKYIKYTGKLYYKVINQKNSKWQNHYCLVITNKKICNDLLKLGMTKSKSLILKFPTKYQVSKRLLKHFLRGYTDGDGYIGKYRVSVVSSVYFINKLSEILSKKGILYKIYDAKNPLTKRLFISRKADYMKYLNWIYSDSSVYMNRKYQCYLNKITPTK